jgi:hypothetical protein
MADLFAPSRFFAYWRPSLEGPGYLVVGSGASWADQPSVGEIRTFLLAADTGQVEHVWEGVTAVAIADLDGDGLTDLIGLGPKGLYALKGMRPERSRRVGRWLPGLPVMASRFRWPPGVVPKRAWREWHYFTPALPAGDFNDDGVGDVVVSGLNLDAFDVMMGGQLPVRYPNNDIEHDGQGGVGILLAYCGKSGCRLPQDQLQKVHSSFPFTGHESFVLLERGEGPDHLPYLKTNDGGEKQRRYFPPDVDVTITRVSPDAAVVPWKFPKVGAIDLDNWGVRRPLSVPLPWDSAGRKGWLLALGPALVYLLLLGGLLVSRRWVTLSTLVWCLVLVPLLQAAWVLEQRQGLGFLHVEPLLNSFVAYLLLGIPLFVLVWRGKYSLARLAGLLLLLLVLGLMTVLPGTLHSPPGWISFGPWGLYSPAWADHSGYGGPYDMGGFAWLWPCCLAAWQGFDWLGNPLVWALVILAWEGSWELLFHPRPHAAGGKP